MGFSPLPVENCYWSTGPGFHKRLGDARSSRASHRSKHNDCALRELQNKRGQVLHGYRLEEASSGFKYKKFLASCEPPVVESTIICRAAGEGAPMLKAMVFCLDCTDSAAMLSRALAKSLEAGQCRVGQDLPRGLLVCI